MKRKTTEKKPALKKGGNIYNRPRERCHPLGWCMRAAEVILDS